MGNYRLTDVHCSALLGAEQSRAARLPSGNRYRRKPVPSGMRRRERSERPPCEPHAKAVRTAGQRGLRARGPRVAPHYHSGFRRNLESRHVPKKQNRKLPAFGGCGGTLDRRPARAVCGLFCRPAFRIARGKCVVGWLPLYFLRRRLVASLRRVCPFLSGVMVSGCSSHRKLNASSWKLRRRKSFDDFW